MTKVQFEAGTGIHFDGGVNFLQSLDGSLYAECPVPDGASEDYGYLTLKAALLNACTNAGIDTGTLSFWYDGQETHLAPDAYAACETWVDIHA